MSAKAKSKIKNNESKLDVIAIAGAADAVVAANPPEEALPENGVTQTHVEPTSTIAASTVGNVPADEAASPMPLAIRLRIATSKVVVSVFATVRAVEARAVEKVRAWITMADAGISKSLVASEQQLLLRLRVTLE